MQLYVIYLFKMRMKNLFIHPLRADVIFPYHQYKFTIKSKLYNSEQYQNLIGLVTKIDEQTDVKEILKIDGVSQYGTLLKIFHQHSIPKQFCPEKSNQSSVRYTGLAFARFKISKMKRENGTIIAEVQIFSDDISKNMELSTQYKNLVQNLKMQLKTFNQLKLSVTPPMLDSQTSINKLIYTTISNLSLPPQGKLKFLQIEDFQQKIRILSNYLHGKISKLKDISGIETKVEREVNGTNNSTPKNGVKISIQPRTTVNTLQQKIQQAKLPPHVRLHIQRQFKNMGQDNDKSVAQRYIQTLLQIPWLQNTQDIKDLSLAEKVLDQEHTGLKQVKERILQYLAVKFRNGNSKGNILCLHGPPGVGKTSVAKSIAKALGRSYARISLGGLNDQSQLRGHRRTYIAAMPGKIIQALIKAKSNNPIILLDQIEKIGKSHKGDPEHALLQILDPSQNNSFVDHYVGLPVDLSKVIFICTANSLQLTMPLLNRLELIEVPGYSREEKLNIARNHLIPLQIKENGVQGLIQFEEDGIKQTIKYSNQLGVRDLQRNISKICRKVARNGVKQQITKEKIAGYLGQRQKNQLWSGVGIVNGMAWTQMGGKILTIEAIQYRSLNPKINVTGQLGEVMKESAKIALSWVKSNFQEIVSINSQLTHIERSKIFEESSIHIHFPEGATKKDGPSAGVALVTCLLSLLLKKPPREHLSMTGEITLSGKVLAVGGIRQKCMAAIYQGIKHIIIPYDNLKDIQKIDEQLRRNVQFYPVKEIRQVLSVAFPNYSQKFSPKL